MITITQSEIERDYEYGKISKFDKLFKTRTYEIKCEIISDRLKREKIQEDSDRKEQENERLLENRIDQVRNFFKEDLEFVYNYTTFEYFGKNIFGYYINCVGSNQHRIEYTPIGVGLKSEYYIRRNNYSESKEEIVKYLKDDIKKQLEIERERKIRNKAILLETKRKNKIYQEKKERLAIENKKLYGIK